MSDTAIDWKTFIAGKRAASRLSQSEFATRFKLNVRTLQNWECGRSQPHRFYRPSLLKKLQKISENTL